MLYKPTEPCACAEEEPATAYSTRCSCDGAMRGDEGEMARLENRKPGVRIGPHDVAWRAKRGEDLDRVADAAAVQDRNRGLQG